MARVPNAVIHLSANGPTGGVSVIPFGLDMSKELAPELRTRYLGRAFAKDRIRSFEADRHYTVSGITTAARGTCGRSRIGNAAGLYREGYNLAGPAGILCYDNSMTAQ